MKSGFSRQMTSCLLVHLVFAALTASCLLAGAMPAAAAQPAILGVGMTPNQATWSFTPQYTNKDVKFWLRVQRQGNLNRFGTFDYYFRIKVVRPDGTEVWNTRYGFDEQGYAEQVLVLPAFFHERSVNRSTPSLGTWKVRIFVEDINSRSETLAKEFRLDFTNGRTITTPQSSVQSDSLGRPFPVPRFAYQRWQLKDWGVGIIDENAAGPDSYDKKLTVRESRKSFSLKEVSAAWGQGHQFGAWLTGPPVDTYRNTNNMPLYLFTTVLHRPDGSVDGRDPAARSSKYANNPGFAVFPFDLRAPGNYRIEFLLRERDRNSWEAASWVSIGFIDFNLTE